MKKKTKAKVKTTIPRVYYLLFPLIVTAIFFAPLLGFDILNWDDAGYILENPLLKNFSVVKLFTTYWMGNYHPLTMLLFTIGYKLVGFHGLYFHLINLVFHLINVYLVFRLVEKLVPNNWFVAMLTALLFGIHPMHIESVAWISELKDVLYTTFFLLSLNSYIRYLNLGGKDRYMASLFFFLLSLLSKGQAVVLTPVIILVDILWKRKYTTAVIVEKIPFLVLSICFGLLALKAQQSVSALSYGMVDAQQNFLYGFYNYMCYLQRVIYPGVLSGIHPYTPTAPGLLYAFTLLFLLFIAAGLWISRKTGLRTFFGLAFFVVTISIVVKFIPVGEELLAERYTYIPYIGLFMLVALLFSWLLHELRYKTAGVIILTIYMFSLIVPGFRYLITYKNSETYWLNTIKSYPLYWRPHYTVALYYAEINQNNKAIDHNTLAIKLVSQSDRKELANLYYNRASVFVNKLSEFSRALDDYRKVLEYDSLKKDIYFYMGYCCTRMDRMEEASFYLNRHLKQDSTNGQAYYLLSVCNTRFNRYQDAYENLGKAIQLQPGLNDAYLQRAMVCIDYLSKQEEALKDLSFLVSQGYKPERVNLYLAICYLHLGQNNEVIACSDKAISLGGDKGKALFLKALAYDKMKLQKDAYRCGQAAITAGFQVDANLMRKWKSAGGL